MLTNFRTHKGHVVSGSELQAALSKVAADWREIAHNIRKQDCYAAHVSEETKDEHLTTMLAHADEIEQGCVDSFTIWQRVNTVLTGECVALLT